MVTSQKLDAVRAVVGASNKNIRDDKHTNIAETLPGVVGEVPEPPAGRISQRIDKGERTLEFFRRGDSGRTIGTLGQQLVSDVKTLLGDVRAIVELVNDDDVISDILHHSYDLLRATITGKGYGPRMPAPAVIENWRMIVASLFTSADVLDMFSAGGTLVHTLHEADEFIVKLAEVRSLIMELLLSIPSQQEASLPVEEEGKWAGLRAGTMEDLRVTWGKLSRNRVWRSMHRRRHNNESKDERNIFGVWFDFLQHELTQVWIDDLCELLQRVVGDRVNVDDALEATFCFLESVSQNTQLLVLIYDFKDTFARLTYNQTRLDEGQIENLFLHLAETIQHMKDEIKMDPTSEKAYQECSKVLHAIKSEPTTARLFKDAKKLWKHLKSKNLNEFMNPQVVESLRHMILPIALEHLNTITFPPIKASGDFMGKVEYTLDNIHVDITSIMPSNIHMKFECLMEHQGTRFQAQRTLIYVEVRKVHINLHNVNWNYVRHSFPRTTDSGVVDISSIGEGMIIRMTLELKEGLTHKRVLEPLAIRCYMDDIKLKFSGSKHDRFYNFLTGLLSTKVKREIQKNFEERILNMTTAFNEAVAALVAHVKARPTSPFLGRRRSSMSRRASISRRPSVVPSIHALSSIPPAFRAGSVSMASYEPPASRNLELPSSRLALPARRGAATAPLSPLRSTYPAFSARPPSPPVVCDASPLQPTDTFIASPPRMASPPQFATSPQFSTSPEEQEITSPELAAISASPSSPSGPIRPRPTSLPAAFSMQAAVTEPSQKVRFQEERLSTKDMPSIPAATHTHKDEIAKKPPVSILRRPTATFPSPTPSPLISSSSSSSSSHPHPPPLSLLPEERSPPHNNQGPFKELDYAVYKYLQTKNWESQV